MVLVTFFILLISGLSFGLLQEGLGSRKGMQHHESNLRALEIAEAGLVRAEMELRALLDTGMDGIGNATGTYAGGSYAVTMTDDPASPTRWVLTAQGEHGHSVRRIQVGVRRRTGRYYAEALFSVENLPVSNVTTDAYDSRLGPYAGQATNTDSFGTYALPNGSIGSNANVELGGSAVIVRGDAIPGPGQGVVVSGDPTVTGDMLPRTAELEVPDPTIAEFTAAYNTNDNNSLSGGGNGNRFRYRSNSKTLDVSGNSTVNFPGGTYFFTDVTFHGGSTINVTGPVKIYVTGSVTIGSGTNIVASNPADVQIIAHPFNMPSGTVPEGAETVIKVNGGSSVTWTMYGPKAALDIGGGNDFYGAAIGNRVELNGENAFHYDVALGEGQGDWLAMLERLYWRDLAPPQR